ncbi:predicted protein [Sclerotinia sclerotiorum 1980 UF-70]|uniref:Uncharacterized protein n=1 Tax=Sclerotinia sclerotiorum (strain ATCC 18683 / 1980 / Ss-1) TaxID=665079 RepID=A7EBS1_SCLS1|nr:predicted protein [Sclerotinia sclerotiorum 1980 UF-70]EDN99899.1 predicted protein [Sclerotinia sclerotiorum 1980 UF-70]
MAIYGQHGDPSITFSALLGDDFSVRRGSKKGQALKPPGIMHIPEIHGVQ